MTAPVKLALQIAVGSATICALGPVELGWIEGIPLTLQTFAVLVVPLLVGARAGVAAVALYLALGFAGLPVFAGGTAGIEKLYGNTGGFLLAFLLGAALVGSVRDRGWAERWWVPLAAMLAGHTVIVGPGMLWLWIWTNYALDGWLMLQDLVPGLLVKSAAGAGLVMAVDRVRLYGAGSGSRTTAVP